MQFRARLDRITDALALGAKWDGLVPADFLAKGVFSPAEKSLGMTEGETRCRTMLAAVVALYWLMRPAALRHKQAVAPTEIGRQRFESEIVQAEEKAASVCEMIGAGPDDSPERWVELLLANCETAGFTPSELGETERKPRASRVRFECATNPQTATRPMT
jgi:hypothetical protein